MKDKTEYTLHSLWKTVATIQVYPTFYKKDNVKEQKDLNYKGVYRMHTLRLSSTL